MRILFAALLFCVLPLATHAEGEGQRITEVTVLNAENTADLFDRVRDAHARAVQRGTIAMNSAGQSGAAKH